MTPRWPQDRPTWPQDGPKMAPRCPRWLQDGPTMAQDGPKIAQDGPKMAPRWAQDGSKNAPRRAQDGFRSHLIAIICCIIFVLLKIPRPRPPKTARRSLRDRPGTPSPPAGSPLGPPWDGPRWLQEGPKTAKDQRRDGHIRVPNEWRWPVMRRRRSRSGHHPVGRDKM